MNRTASVFFSITRGLLYATVFLLPLIYLSSTLDALEINKQTILLLLVFAQTLTWLGGVIADKTFSFRKGWLNILPLAFLLSASLSAAFSLSPYRSWIGSSTQEYTSVLSIFAFVLLFYLVANKAAHRSVFRAVSGALLSSSLVVAVIGICSLLGWSLLPQQIGFNTIGTYNALGFFLLTVSVFAQILWMIDSREKELFYKDWIGVIQRVGVFLLSILTLAILFFIHYWVLWMVLLFSSALVLAFMFTRPNHFPQWQRSLPIVSMLVISLVMLFLVNVKTPLSIPIELTPSFSVSTDITVNTLKEDSFLFGSGPGTFQYQYAQFHSADINTTPYWDTRFDRGFSFVHVFIGAYGILGTVITLIFLFMIGKLGIAHALSKKDHEAHIETMAVMVPWFTLLFGWFFYGANITLIFLFTLFSGLIASRVLPDIAIKTFLKNRATAVVSYISLFLFSVLVVTLVFVNFQRYGADVTYAQAVRLDRVGGDIGEVVRLIDKAATFNRFEDIYFRNLASSYLLFINEQIQNTPQSELTTTAHQDFIEALAGASVNAAKRSTDLSPSSVTNWMVLGSVYRELSPLTANASSFSVDAYEKASKLEPANPEVHTELGKAYFSAAQLQQQLLGSEDESLRNEARRDMEQYLARAQGAFERAIELKVDYAPAHFQLALVLEVKGEIDDAIRKMELLVVENDLDVGVHFQLGMLYMRRDQVSDLARAQRSFERAIELVPGYANAHWFLASVYEKQGNNDRAIEEVLKVIQLDPENPLAKSRLIRLQRVPEEIPEEIELPSDDEQPLE